MRSLLSCLVLALLAASGLLLPAGCGGSAGREEGVPLPTAYPRFTPYDSCFTPACVDGVEMEYNSEADTARKGETWLDIAYPRYGSTIHLSVNRAASPGEYARMVSNRRQRMALNLGESRSREDVFENAAGFECLIVRATDGSSTVTPVQFMACDAGEGRVVSGVFALARRAASADSVAPLVEAAYRDVFHLLATLKPCTPLK